MVVWLVNAGDSYEQTIQFIEESQVAVPCLLDQDKTYYDSYPFDPNSGAYAPFPLQVVIDQQGVVQYLSRQYDAELVRATIDSLLAD